MPHIVVKLFPGRSEEQKTKFTQQVVKDAMAALDCSEEHLSVAFEEIAKEDWPEKVYRPEILNNANLYKKPGYNPFK
jgi:4-oxalocrotonate tautomerase